MSKSTVAVTGAAGFIGSAVVRKLLEQRRTVRCIVEPGGSTQNLEDLPVERVTCDVTDFAATRKALEGCESLFHLAAIYKTWLPDEELIYRVNVEGTVTTLLAAQAAGLRRIVYTSSIAAVGLVPGGPSPRNFRDHAFQTTRTDAQIKETIMNGKGTAMPPFGAVFDDAQLGALVAHVRSLDADGAQAKREKTQ